MSNKLSEKILMDAGLTEGTQQSYSTPPYKVAKIAYSLNNIIML